MRIGVDIGGTKVVIGLIDNNGVVSDRLRFQSKGFSSAQALSQEIGHQILELLDRSNLSLTDIQHFGVGIPGTANWETGVVLYSPNLLGQNVPLADELEKSVGIRPIIVQDSWAGALAEYLFGQHRQTPDMMCITLGTGIGCGIMHQGKVFAGAMRTAGEIGHVAIVPNGRLCSCGKRGCLEAYASGTGIYAQALERFGNDLCHFPEGCESVFALAAQGHAEALQLIDESVDKLAFGLATLVDIISCSTIFISGGLAIHEEFFIKPLRNKIRQYGYPAWSLRFVPEVQKAALGYDAPLIGAAFLDASYIG